MLKQYPPPSRQQGVSLVELMVALLIGLFIIGASISVFTATIGANSTQIRSAKLNNELRTVMTYITRDMRRAGYNNWSIADMTNRNFPSNAQAAANITASSAEVSYYLDSANTAQRFGFQHSGNVIQAKIGASGTWTDLTDPSVLEITGFNITDASPETITVDATTINFGVYIVQITGRLTADQTVTRTIRETVRFRNNIVGP